MLFTFKTDIKPQMHGLERIRKKIGITSEQVCARAGKSKTTFLNADRGTAAPETTRKFLEILEGFRRERIEELSGLEIKVG